MDNESVPVDPEVSFHVSACLASLEADLDGYDREYEPMQKMLLEEGFGFHVNKCLLDMTEEDFQRLNFLLTELKPLLAREHARAVDTDTLTTPPDEEMIETSSGEQLKTIFSKRGDGMDFETFKKQAMPSLKKMVDQSRKEGAEKRKKGIAWRMQCLGFPLHTILRVTGYTPATETPGDPGHVWR